MQLPQPQVPLAPPPPPAELVALLADLQDQDFQGWRRHPVSQVVLRFLADRSADLQAQTLFRWLSGQTTLQQEEELRGRVLALNEVLALEWKQLQQFYANRRQQGDNPRERG